MHSRACNNAVYQAVGEARKQCSSELAGWTVVFSFFELFLSQLGDFHSLWCGLPVSPASASCGNLGGSLTGGPRVSS